MNSENTGNSLQFILTIGTIIFGAFVAVRIFGLEVGSGDEIDLRKSNKRQIRTRRSSRQSSSEGRRPRLPFGGPLADLSDEDEDASGLMDVWFEVSRKSEPNPVSKKKPGKSRAGDGKGSRTRQA